MKRLAKQTNVNQDKLTSSWELWDYLIEKAGLDVESYDMHIAAMICMQLNIPMCKKYKDDKYEDKEFKSNEFRKELKDNKISVERFIGAFFKAIEPYAMMMTDLCVFFYVHRIKKTNDGMKILFDFGDGPEDLGFDLNHFKESLRKIQKITQAVTIIGWNQNTLWTLASIFENFRHYNPHDRSAADWLRNYNNGDFSPNYPTLPQTGIVEIDLWLQRSWRVWADVITEIRKHDCKTRKQLRELGQISMEEQFQKSNSTLEDVESYEYIKRIQELPDFREWNAYDLFALDSNLWPETMLRSLFCFTEHITEITQEKRAGEAHVVIGKLKELFSSVPYWEEERETLLEGFEDLLNLPFWKKRYELYQTWVMTQIDKALSGYQRIIHHCDGELILKFSGTHIGTIETEKGRLHLWGELRSPLSNPVSKKRKGHIQPDYSL
ncbi:MAG: hypothetical protein HQL01_11420 [Nitrospirae bacterium]|nr:hypothetical protein [Nitrospirota bacterium]